MEIYAQNLAVFTNLQFKDLLRFMEYDALDANMFRTDTCLIIYPYSSATLASPKVLQHLYPVKQSPAAQTLFQRILEISFLTLLR